LVLLVTAVISLSAEIGELRDLQRPFDVAFNKVRTYRAAHEDEKARVAFEEFLKMERAVGGDDSVYIALRSEGHFCGDSPEAMSYYDRALALKPDSGYAHLYRGEWFLRHKQFAQAVVALDGATGDDFCLTEIYQARSDAYIGLNKLDWALANVNSAIAIDPQNYCSVAARARVYAKMRKNDLALADWNATIALAKGEVPSFYEQRAELYDSINETDRAHKDRATAAHLKALSKVFVP